MKKSIYLLLCTLTAAIASPRVCEATLVLASYDFTGGSGASSDTDSKSLASEYDPRTDAIGGSPKDSNLSSGSGNAFMRATSTPTSSSPVGDTNNYYHVFTLDVTGLAAGETLSLTTLSFDYGPNTSASFGGSSFFSALYSPAIGLTDTSDKIGGLTLNGGENSTGSSEVIDLTPTNSVVGTVFSDLVNGDSVELRLYYGDNSSSQSRIHRLDNVVLSGQIVAIPEPSVGWFLGLGATALWCSRRR